MIAATAGAGLGALLGYGPMLRYKSEGVLNMDMGTSEYKRFTELANDASSASQFLDAFPPPKMPSGGVDAMVKAVVRGEWHKVLPKADTAKKSKQMLRERNCSLWQRICPKYQHGFYCATLRTESP